MNPNCNEPKPNAEFIQQHIMPIESIFPLFKNIGFSCVFLFSGEDMFEIQNSIIEIFQ